MPDDVRATLEENLLLFYTGVRRSASEELAPQSSDAGSAPRDLTDNLDARARRSATRAATRSSAGDLDAFAGLLTEQWRLKLERAPEPGAPSRSTTGSDAGIEAGALGGKLVGAGGGGFLLFYAEPQVGPARRDGASSASRRSASASTTSAPR